MNAYETALMVASDKAAVAAAGYRNEINEVMALTKSLAGMAVMNRSWTSATRAIETSYRKIRAIIEGGLDELNYKHQLYLAEELGKFGGISVTVKRARGEVGNITVAGKPARAWVDAAFVQAKRRARRAVTMDDYQLSQASVDELNLSLLRTMMVFSAMVDLGNKAVVNESVLNGLSDI